MATKTITHEMRYRPAAGPGPSTQTAMASTLPDVVAFGDTSAAVQPRLTNILPVGSMRDERVISGANRYKYFRRPIIPFMNAQPPEVIFAGSEEIALPASDPEPEPEPASKDMGCQSDYRESETQTNPYTPEYLVPAGTDPEVLSLATMVHGAGLPAGLKEVKIIERMRQKREFDASLPPMTDELSMALRRKMMGEQELREWNVREDEIAEVQAEKLGKFEAKMREHKEMRELHWDERIEHQRQIKLTEKDKEISQIQRRRIKALRKLSEARKDVDSKKELRDIVKEYADYGSEVYAPLARNGYITRDKLAHQYEIKSGRLNSVEGILELEASIPSRMLEPKVITRPDKKGQTPTFQERMEQRMQDQLNRTDAALKSAKQAKPSEKEQKEALLAAYRDTKPIERPPTPTVMPPEHDEAMEHAVILLQRLLRGRAVQNTMYEGKERRLELIKELRTDELYTAAQDEDDSTALSNDDLAAGVVDSMQAEIVGSSLDRMSKELRRYTEERRVAELVREAERTRRIREAEESGRRQKEIIQRAVAEECFQQVMRVHQASAASFLDDLVVEVIESTAAEQARYEADLKHTRVNVVVAKVEEEHSVPGTIVGDVVNGFLLPEVHRQKERREAEMEEEKFANASRRAMNTVVDSVQAIFTPD